MYTVCTGKNIILSIKLYTDMQNKNTIYKKTGWYSSRVSPNNVVEYKKKNVSQDDSRMWTISQRDDILCKVTYCTLQY